VEVAQGGFEGFEALAEAGHLVAHLAERAGADPAEGALDEVGRAVARLAEPGLDGLLARPQRALAEADEVVQEAGGESARPAPPLFREDLRQDGRRHVLPAAVVDHPDLLAGADPVGEFVEGDVPALAGVVELAAPVAFDEAGHGRRAGSAALTHRGKAGFRAASIHATSASASRISGMSMHAGCALPDLIPSGC